MIRLDYWNHPLVVKAIRVKYRGGTMFVLASGYLLVLLVGAIAMYRYRDLLPGDWVRNYFVAMISLQFGLSALIAAAAVSASMQAEVTTRTLDFQRIAALSPAQILLGKVVGEPASAYLLAMASVPVGVLCHTLGAVTWPELLLIYLTLASSTFMMACLGTQQPLEPGMAGRVAAGGAGGAGCVGGLVWMSVMVSIARSSGRRFPELVNAGVGLLTPVLTIIGIKDDMVWADHNRMPFFTLHIPYILLTPIAQTGAAVLALSWMVRRLTYPLTTPCSKLQSYLVLAIVDLVWAGFVFDTLRTGEGLTGPGVRFAIGHMIAALLLVTRSTPGRQTYLSWVWRLRGRRSLAMDLLVGERTLNAVALVVYCAIGWAVFAAAVAVPAMVSNPGSVAQTLWPALGIAWSVSTLVILSYGSLYQAFSLAAEKGAGSVLVLMGGILMLAPYGAGEYFQEPLLASLSPIGTFVRLLLDPAEPYAPLPIVGLHVVATALWGWLVLLITRRMAQQVDRKLVAMGVARK